MFSVAVVVAFFICWAPFHAQRLVAIYGSRDRMMKLYEIVTYISGILYYVSTTINPILYHTMSLKFREAFKDTLARCCGFRGIKGRGTRRSYSILSRSAQRGGPLGSNAGGQESTDYSGNSVREEVLPSGQGSGGSCGSSLKDAPIGTRRSFRSHQDKSSNSSVKWVSPGEGLLDPTSPTSRTYSVLIRGTQIDLRTATVERMNTDNDQNLRGNQIISQTGKSIKLPKNGKRGIWKTLRCVKGATDIIEDNKVLSVSYSPTPPAGEQGNEFRMSSEMFGMIPVIRSSSIRSLASSSNNVSNSSLRDVERGALEDELTTYMQELRQREVC